MEKFFTKEDFEFTSEYNIWDILYSCSTTPTNTEIKEWIVIGQVLLPSSVEGIKGKFKYELCSYPISKKMNENDFRDSIALDNYCYKLFKTKSEAIEHKKLLLTEYTNSLIDGLDKCL